MSLRDRDRGGQPQVCTRRALGVSQRERSLNRQIVKSTSPRQRDTRSGKWRKHYYSRLFFGALRQSRFSRSRASRTRETYRTVHVYIHILTHVLPWMGSVYTRTNCCTSTRTRAPVYTLKGGYIGFPVTTNLPRHRAIYISVESIASTKNQ